MNNNDGNEKRDINLNSGNYNERIEGDYIQGDSIKQEGSFGVGVNQGTVNYNSSPEKPFKPIKYIPTTASANFVGREDELVKVHEKLYEQNNRVAISAVSGMGGIGKTELAIQYANQYENDYSGGICWLNARGGNVAGEIIQFIQQKMELEVPQKDRRENVLTLEQQVAWCWLNWRPPEGSVLVILDDVAEYKDVKKLLPRTDSKRFKLLITTRLRRLDPKFVDIPLDVLSEDESLSLLKGILGEEDTRIEDELQTAKDLCQWLGYLPLGLELVGRYLLEDPDLSIADMLEELKEERLDQQAINPEPDYFDDQEMTAKLGVQAAFNLTWLKLEEQTQHLGELLSLFASDTIPWKLVEKVSQGLNWDSSNVDKAKKQLYKFNLIQQIPNNSSSYRIHVLIRDFLKDKLAQRPLGILTLIRKCLRAKLFNSKTANDFEWAFVTAMAAIAKEIPQTLTSSDIELVKDAIPHLTEVAEKHLDAVSDGNLYSVFVSLGKFYQEQGLYTLAEPWYQQYVEVVKSRLGEKNSKYPTSLNELALLYSKQGKYEQAESLYKQALELIKQLLGENHPSNATNLNNLAHLYHLQGKYDKAEPLCTQALELRKQLLGENHPDTTTSLNNLALLYSEQGKYEQAETLNKQALELYKQLLGENHPDYAQSLNNLAVLYYFQGKFCEAEPLLTQALDLYKHLLGENHPRYAQSLNNLAYLYSEQGKYYKAEPLYTEALEITQRTLGSDNSLTETCRENLEILRRKQQESEDNS